MVYVLDNSAPGLWTNIDADDELPWGLTRSAFADTLCDINGGLPTFETLLDYLDDGAPAAVIVTVQIGKGAPSPATSTLSSSTTRS